MTSSTLAGETGSRKVEAIAQRHPWLVAVCRLGWVAKGVVYLVVGLLAVPIAVDGLSSDTSGGAQTEASQSGAVAKIAENSAGSLALWIIAIGLFLYVVWRLISIVLPAENSAKAWFTRVGYLVERGRLLSVGVVRDELRPPRSCGQYRRERGRQGRALHP